MFEYEVLGNSRQFKVVNNSNTLSVFPSFITIIVFV